MRLISDSPVSPDVDCTSWDFSAFNYMSQFLVVYVCVHLSYLLFLWRTLIH